MNPSKTAERQARHRDRLKAKGLVHVQGWVTPEQATAIRAIMAGQSVTYNAGPAAESQTPSPPAPKPIQRKLTKLDPDTLPIPPRERAGITTAYRVLEDGERIGLVWKGTTGWYAKHAKKASVLDALSNPRLYRTRERAVAAL